MATRLLFAGKLIRQPYLRNRPRRVSSILESTVRVMTWTFCIGAYLGLSVDVLGFATDKIKQVLDGTD